jgi:plasmid stabilization system protein ParE
VNQVNIQPRAITDAERAARWYEARRPGLGSEFILELDAAIEKAAIFPAICALIYRHVRRVLLRRFPYAVYFTFDSSVIEVFAILHLRRAQENWSSRVREAE